MPTDPHPDPPAPVLAIHAPPPTRDNPLTRSPAGIAGVLFLAAMLLACLLTLPWTLAPVREGAASVPRYNAGSTSHARLPPSWFPYDDEDWRRVRALLPPEALAAAAAPVADRHALTPAQVLDSDDPAVRAALHERLRELRPFTLLGTDPLGRSLFVRVLTGGGISLLIGIAAASISVAFGSLYGALAGYFGGPLDSALMRIVDVLYGLPYVLLVVLLAVASTELLNEFETRSRQREAWLHSARERWTPPAPDALLRDPRFSELLDRHLAAQSTPAPPRDQAEARLQSSADRDALLTSLALTAVPPRRISATWRTALDVLTLLIAIAAVSWLTVARVVRGQVLSLKNQPFVEAARAMGAPTRRIFLRHLFPNLVGPIVVYATLAVPQAILQESFLSFLGIGVKAPLPSWGNLAADALSELNLHRSHWWLLFFPCLLLALTLLALNFVGEGLRDAFDPRRARR